MRIAPDSRSFFFMPSLRVNMAAAGIALGFMLAPAHAASPAGVWLTQKGDARIHIAPCGKALCGTVVWLKDPYDHKTGKPPVDEQNPDPRLRQRKIIGLRIFAMTPDGHGGWRGGIYNSDDGRTYRGKLSLQAPDALNIEGCVGAICSGEIWRKVGR
jgi:uncharacterized protein (DUF2147 family)